MSSSRIGNLSMPGWVADLDGVQTVNENRHGDNGMQSAGNETRLSQIDAVDAINVDDFDNVVSASARINAGPSNGGIHSAEPCIRLDSLDAAPIDSDSRGGKHHGVSVGLSQLPVDSAGACSVDDFDGVQSSCNGRGGMNAKADVDKQSGLNRELQSVMEKLQHHILEHLDSQFSTCERRLIENMSKNFQQLSESGLKRVSKGKESVGPSVQKAETENDSPIKKIGANLKFKNAWKGVLAGIEQKKLVEVTPHPPDRKGIHFPEPPDKKMEMLTVNPAKDPAENDSNAGEAKGYGAAGRSKAPPKRSMTARPEGKGPHGVFASADDMKEKLRREMLLPKYEVSDLYKTEGVCQKIARAQSFEYFTLGVISINAVWMAIDIDYNSESVLTNSHPVFQIGENLFCLYFTFEWVVRFSSFRNKRQSISDRWFCLDTMLVAMMILETWVMTLVYAFFIDTSSGGSGIGNASIFRLVRLIRLTRMARLAKLLRAMPELMTIVKGMFIAARTVFFMLCLLVCTVYVFAIAFRQITEGTAVGDQYFSTVLQSMGNLLLRGNLPDVNEFVTNVSSPDGGNFFFGVLLMIFICIGYVTLLNMLVGVLVSVVTVTASVEKEELTIVYVKDMMERAFHAANIGTDGGDTISLDDFVSFISHPDAYKALASVDVDVVGLLDFSDFIFQGNASLTFHDFVEIVLRLRGSNKATVKDMVDLRLFLGSEIKQLKAVLLDQMVVSK